MSEGIEIKPVKTSKDAVVQQSKYDVAGRLPLRSILCAPSNSGKTVLLQNMILNHKLYRDCFQRILIFSPSVFLDPTWEPVREYIENKYGPETEDNKYFHETFDPEELEKELTAQKFIVQYYKDKKRRKCQVY